MAPFRASLLIKEIMSSYFTVPRHFPFHLGISYKRPTFRHILTMEDHEAREPGEWSRKAPRL
jgi:hypothetical protein